MKHRKAKRHKLKQTPAKKGPTAVHLMPALENRPGTYSRDLKLRARRVSGVRRSDINVRFVTPEDYALIKSAAAILGESMNLFIITAALSRAKLLESGSSADSPVAQTVS